ncbi:MAG TPA: COX aromatic rich motif-containing protein [Candidatus Saccharimonadales bacterium]|nr:COX aromatic rich motif-containing protein [Candidatus Saccharimonadales bacterium]
MAKNKKRHSNVRMFGLIFAGLVALGSLMAVLMRGNNIALFHTRGFIAHEQMGLMVLTTAVMLALAIPALFLFYYFAWKYRESNTKAVHDPNLRHSRWLDITIWLVPTVFAVMLAMVMWPATHKLEPRDPIPGGAKPLVIQVVSLRWKWLFIYPEQNIATVNYVQFPVDRPVQFELTADEAPMSSFWIPNLGGQLYSMTGHVNRLNLIASTTGNYGVSSAEINGAGFSGMKFTARASSQSDFDLWVQSVWDRPQVLDTAAYNELLKPSEDNPPAYYSAAQDGLYDTVVNKYMGSHGGMPGHGMKHE